MSNEVLATLQGLKSHFLLQLSEMPEYRAMKALEKTIAEVTEILAASGQNEPRRQPHQESEPAELRAAEAAIASVIPARTASPTALRIPTMPVTRRF